MERHYIIKDGMKDEIKKQSTFRNIAQKIGVTEGYISQVMNGRKTTISKVLAYAICKAISSNLEIQDVFNIIEK